MKYNWIALLLMLQLIYIDPATGQESKTFVDKANRNILVHVSQGDSLAQISVMLHLKVLKKNFPQANIEVVFQGKSLRTVMSSYTKVASDIAELRKMNVVFAACETTMARASISREELLPEATTVPSAVVEVVLKQEAGWSYIKEH